MTLECTPVDIAISVIGQGRGVYSPRVLRLGDQALRDTGMSGRPLTRHCAHAALTQPMTRVAPGGRPLPYNPDEAAELLRASPSALPEPNAHGRPRREPDSVRAVSDPDTSLSPLISPAYGAGRASTTSTVNHRSACSGGRVAPNCGSFVTKLSASQ